MSDASKSLYLRCGGHQNFVLYRPRTNQGIFLSVDELYGLAQYLTSSEHHMWLGARPTYIAFDGKTITGAPNEAKRQVVQGLHGVKISPKFQLDEPELPLI